jgi:hypothetical protein
MSKRGQNEGTIFEEKPGRWVASISLGYEIRNGKPLAFSFVKIAPGIFSNIRCHLQVPG